MKTIKALPLIAVLFISIGGMSLVAQQPTIDFSTRPAAVLPAGTTTVGTFTTGTGQAQDAALAIYAADGVNNNKFVYNAGTLDLILNNGASASGYLRLKGLILPATPDASSSGCNQYPCRVGTPVVATNQTASIGAQTLYTTTAAGQYQVSVSGFTSTTGSAGSVTFTVNCNIGAGAVPQTTASMSLTSFAQTNSVFACPMANASNVQYLTTVTGNTDGIYAFYITVTRLQ